MIDLLYRAARPALRLVEPETAHRLAIAALRAGLGGRRPEKDDPILRTTVAGLAFANPLGLGAGFDKHGEVVDPMLGLGFGHVEIGTVTPKPQPGNPRPRLFRLDGDRAVINRYGFNSQGSDAVAARLADRTARAGILGINLGKNKHTVEESVDFVAGVRILGPLADYLVVNVSSPNTPGLRDLQARSQIERLIADVLAERDRTSAAERRPPVFVKLAPDLDDGALDDVAQVALATGLDGLIMGNTTISRPPGLRDPARAEGGGLSGRPLQALANERLSRLYTLTSGKIPLIGSGGVGSAEDAYARIRSGASLVQLYSALVFEGPGLAARINRGLASCLRRDGFRSVAAAVGADHQR